MNKPNNKRRVMSQEKIKNAFMVLIRDRDVREVTVSDIVKLAKINRSTFYANYLDVYDLVDHIKEEMFLNIIQLYQTESKNMTHSHNFLKLFQHIEKNQDYYMVLFKLNFDFSQYYNSFDETTSIQYLGTTKNVDYHIEYFKAGMNAIIKKWLAGGCKETPEEMNEILISEYSKKRL